MFPAEDDERFPDTQKNIINSVTLVKRKERFHWLRNSAKGKLASKLRRDWIAGGEKYAGI